MIIIVPSLYNHTVKVEQIIKKYQWAKQQNNNNDDALKEQGFRFNDSVIAVQVSCNSSSYFLGWQELF